MSAADSRHSLTVGWKERLKWFHKRGEKTDYFGGSYDSNIIPSALAMVEGGDPLVFPAKSYIVAICYADFIARHYQEDFYQVLRYPHLLHDDEHFSPYSEENQVIYDVLIPHVMSETFKLSELYQVIMGYCLDELGWYQTL